MTTLLNDSPVFRETDVEISGRRVIVGLETQDGKPILSLRAKGYKTGWYYDLAELAKVAGLHPRLKGAPMPISAHISEEKEQCLREFNWAEKYGKENLLMPEGTKQS